ncbi:MAG TPA: hydrogenase expression/formation protein HypE [Minicystis sp.]|nr:hydrogenase expression/formation protein HypE [Minicystis sp.]
MTAEAPFPGCPAPLARYERIVLGHGGGGRLTADLVNHLFVPTFGGDVLAALEDQATLDLDGGRIAVTTDAFVVHPLFFPGGDIGSLAVHGTVNDLAVGGAEPRWLTAAFVLEEGLPLATLAAIARSMRAACDAAGVSVVAGDTKVVERGKADGVFITTTGVGVVPAGRRLSIAAARPGDRVVVSGPLGDHGVAILSVRQGLEFETALASDSAPVVALARAVLSACPAVRCMRDPTRGGLASVLNEIGAAARVGVVLDDARIPLRPAVRAACDLFGIDPLHVASEGRLVAVVPAADADRVVAALAALPAGEGAAVVGEVISEHPGVVTLRSDIGGERVVPLLAGEPLPRIC